MRFILLRRIVDRSDDRFQSIKTLVNTAHIVSASVQQYTREGHQYDGTLLVLSIGKTMLVEESPDIFWERAVKKKRWWE